MAGQHGIAHNAQNRLCAPRATQAVSTPEDILRFQKTLKPGAPVAVHIVRSIDNGGRHTPPNRLYLSGRLPDE